VIAEPDQLTEKGRLTRRRLVEAAEDELLENGRIEVTKVADRAGVSLGLLYRYFDGKDALVAAVVDRFYDRYEEAVFSTPAPPGVAWLEHEVQRIEAEVEFLFEEPLSRRIVGGTPAEPAAAHADARRLGRHIDMAARNIEHGLRSGEISASVDPVLAAAAIIGGLRSCLAVALAGGSSVRPEQVIDVVTRISAAIITLRDDRPDESAQGRSQ
jgi:AcrR family transcriptional regulator